ncbi:hypothetical protein AcV7_002141 [Taiwanofungus camphoratus]|nr:hypothetical protein AcV7_002141 [Antrodia cinnamomea]
MVPHTTRYFARKSSNVENTPPRSAQPESPLLKTAHSSASNSYREAARRRRIRITGGPHMSRFAVEQAKRRSLTRSPPPQIKFVLSTPPPSPVADVEMSDAQASAAAQAATVTLWLPRSLARPPHQEVQREAIAAIDEELADLPPQYIRDALAVTGPDLVRVLAGARPEPLQNTHVLPRELSVVVNDISSSMPTHMLAVYALRPNAPTHRVSLVPVHSIVLAAHCASLPSLPPSRPAVPDQPGSQIRIPVQSLRLQHAESWPALSAYLYTKHPVPLLATLIPGVPPLPQPGQTRRERLLCWAHQLATTYTVHALLAFAMRVNGLWRNVVALGIHDEGLWAVMDVCWDIYINALSMSLGQALPPPLHAHL